MKYKVYRHFNTNEEVFEEDWEQYAMEKLGITIEPQGKNGEMTEEQLEFIEEFTDWYFSGNWILDEVEDDSVCDDLAEMEDIIYERDLEKKWGIA
ncbi:MAG: hypothetical protein IKF17_05590 [Clostridia bacterium]|nr:hypothetical protein [Clostridia bacterium]